MMRSLSNELSTRARALLVRDGHESTVHLRPPSYDLSLPTLDLWVDDRGTLCVEQRFTKKVIYMETPIGVCISSSPDNILERAIDELRQRMVLEDLADA